VETLKEDLQKYVMTETPVMEKVAHQIVCRFYQLGLALVEIKLKMTSVFQNLEMGK